jgi:hypothetical protein
MAEHIIVSKINFLIGKYVVIVQAHKQLPCGVPVSSAAPGSFDIIGNFYNNIVNFISEEGTAELTLIEVFKEIDSYFTFSTVPDSECPIYQITGLHKLLFYNHTPEMPKYNPDLVHICEYPLYKNLMTSESICYYIDFTLVKV